MADVQPVSDAERLQQAVTIATVAKMFGMQYSRARVIVLSRGIGIPWGGRKMKVLPDDFARVILATRGTGCATPPLRPKGARRGTRDSAASPSLDLHPDVRC